MAPFVNLPLDRGHRKDGDGSNGRRRENGDPTKKYPPERAAAFQDPATFFEGDHGEQRARQLGEVGELQDSPLGLVPMPE